MFAAELKRAAPAPRRLSSPSRPRRNRRHRSQSPWSRRRLRQLRRTDLGAACKELFTPDPPNFRRMILTPKETVSKPKHEIKVDKTLAMRTVPKVDARYLRSRCARSGRKRRNSGAKAIAAARPRHQGKCFFRHYGGNARHRQACSYANYASVVKSVYDRAWTPPDDMSGDDANTKVSVTIGSDGTVIPRASSKNQATSAWMPACSGH